METNRFKQNIYDEFDANCYKVFGVSGTRVHEVLSERGDDLYEVFEQAFDHGGAAFMRLKMLMSIARLEMVYYETKIGRASQTMPSVRVRKLANDPQTHPILRLCF
jgi:hypothetical protein